VTREVAVNAGAEGSETPADPGPRLRVEPYSPTQRRVWNDFIGQSKNATFLLHRDYLEYHADRFTDASALVWDGGKLVALFPGSLHDDQVRSHGGLTYGGVLTDARMSVAQMLEVFTALRTHWREAGVKSVFYKPIPHFYHTLAAEEDLYALFRHGAQLVRRDAATTLRRDFRAPITKGRKWAIKQGQSHGIEVARSQDWDGFMAMETALLEQKFGTRPVHSAAEMALLAERFPQNIKLFTATRAGELLGGTIVYETPLVAHSQYISSTSEGRDLRALDVLFDWLLTAVYSDKSWFDFGMSTEEGGTVLNAGLAANKESWGARTTVYDFYLLEV
jgi:hypothetical protein